MKMTQRQTRPGIAFPNATVPAPVFIEDSDAFSAVATHQGLIPEAEEVSRILVNSAPASTSRMPQ